MTFKVATEADITRWIKGVLKREGGKKAHLTKGDAGGWTRMGITAGTAGDWLNLGRDATEAELNALPLSEIVKIYRLKFYGRRKLALLPYDLQEPILDSAVTSGGHAIKILQRLLNELLTIDGLPTLRVDGGLGPKTLDQVAVYYSRDPVRFRDWYGLSRIGFFMYIADRREDNRRFVRGWIEARANEFITPGRQFDVARVKDYYKWGEGL